MTESSLPYPQIEHIPESPDFIHELSEEARRFPTPKTMQLCITGLRRIYESRPFYESLAYVGNTLAQVASVNPHKLESKRFVDSFTAGGLLGLHAATRYVEPRVIRAVVEAEEIGLLQVEELRDDASHEKAELLAELFADMSTASSFETKLAISHAAALYRMHDTVHVRNMFNLGAYCMQDTVEIAQTKHLEAYSKLPTPGA